MNKRTSPRNNIAARFQNVSSDTLPPIGVFWDIENCQVPKGKSVTALIQAIRERFFQGHREAEFLCVCDINKENKEVIQELNLAQVTVVHINATSKNAADDKLKQCMRRFVDTHGMPATLLLISGDVNFATHLSDFHHRDNIHIILLHPNHTPEPLLVCAHEHFLFNELTENLPSRCSMKNCYNRCELVVKDLPTNRDSKQIYSRLKQLSDNCGGKVVYISGSTAKLRFSNIEAAKRAKKRMDREDVFGKTITVAYFQTSNSGDEFTDCNYQKQYQNKQKPYKNRRHCVSTSSSCNSSPVSQSGMDNDSAEGIKSHNEDMPIAKLKFDFPPPPHITEDNLRTNADKCSEKIFSSQKNNESNSMPYDDQESRNVKWTTCHDQRNKNISPIAQMNKLMESGNKLSQKNVGRVSPFLMLDTGTMTRSETNMYKQSNTTADRYSIPDSSYNSYGSKSPILFTPIQNNTDYQNQVGWNSPILAMVNDGTHPVGRASPIISSSSSSSSSPVELLVTNLDQNFEANEMKKILLSVFREHIMVLHISMLLQPDGSLKAVVKVPSLQDAQYAISQLHRRKIGYKRLLISYASTDRSPPLHILRSEVVALLMDIPSKRLPLFKFREIFERRYHRSISVSELYKMKEAVCILENSTGRMVCLNSDFRYTPSPTDSEGSQEVQQILEKPYCEHHFHVSENLGWAEQDSVYPLPNVHISLKTLAPRVHTLLDSHQGSLPLNSFCLCYTAEFGPLPVTENFKNKYKSYNETYSISSDDDNNGKLQNLNNDPPGMEKGVSLEHLIACIPGVQITKSVLAIKKIQWLENKPSDQDVRSISPALAGQLALFSREMIDLLKSQPRCSIPFNKFIPAYHHHFGRQCRVADYGFTKLIELLEAVPHSVQILGQGQNRVLILTHRAQIKRFSADLLRILKSRASKQITLKELPVVYEQCINKSFDITEYGVCETTDMLAEISENIIVVASSEEETVIGIPKREQTPEEIERTKQFAAEVIELFRHIPNCSMPFNKFIPAYHHHFGKQCRVSDYGFSKLIELFEAIPDVLEVCGIGEEKVLMLTEQEKLKVIADRLVSIVRSSPQQSILLDKLISIYANQHGHSLRCQEFGASDIPELISKLRSSLKMQGHEKPLVVLVDQGFVHLVSLRIRRLLMENIEGKLTVEKLSEQYKERFGHNLNIMNLRQDLEDVIKIENGIIKLAPLLMLCRDILILLYEHGGQILLQNFESSFLKRFGVPCRPAQYGFPSVATMLHSQPDYFIIRGRRSRRIVMVNRDTAGSPLPQMITQTTQDCEDNAYLKNYKTVKMNYQRKDCDIISKVQAGELLQLRNSPVDLLCQPIPSGVPSPEIQPEKQGFPDKDLMRFESPLPLGQDVMTEMTEKERQQLKTPPLCQTSAVVHSPVQNFSPSIETDMIRTLLSNNQAYSAPPSFTHFAIPFPQFRTLSASSCISPTYQTVFQSPSTVAYFGSPLIHSSSFNNPSYHEPTISPSGISSLPVMGQSSTVSYHDVLGSSGSSLPVGACTNPGISVLPNSSGGMSSPSSLSHSRSSVSCYAKLSKSKEMNYLPINQSRSDSVSYEDLTDVGNRSLDDSFPSTQSTPTRGSTRIRPRSRIAAQFSTPMKPNQ